MNKLLKGDEVIIISGKDKGKKGVISARVGESHLLIDGINIVKKHQKPNPNKNQPGGIIDKTIIHKFMHFFFNRSNFVYNFFRHHIILSHHKVEQ